MMKRIKKKNQGNTYIMVVATLSFLAILTAAILVAIAICYKLKAFDINSKDNFYYLEQAMDEIYAGVGSDSMKHLNDAYEDTIEVLVYYDTKSSSYVTMDNDQANKLLKKSFIKRVKDDDNYKDAKICDTLNSFLSNKFDISSNEEGIQLYVNGNVVAEDTDVTIHNVTLKREANYSTINTRKNGGAKDKFVQTVTTDIVISEPEFNVNFNTISSDLSDLYEFSFIADMGVEITGATNNVNISGNLYVASDFYNKEYNKGSKETPSTEEDAIPVNQKSLTSYSENDLKKCNGVNLNSMYSGFYIDGSNVVLACDKLIVPGTIAAMNGADLTISGLSQSSFTPAQVWADNITLAGYSFKTATGKLQGAKVSMRADAMISDDLELNAKGSDFYLNGGYYGYNYASTDNRTYTEDAVMASKKRVFAAGVPQAIKDKEKERYSTVDGEGIKTQAHYNSSAIIVNGEDSNLDLSNVTSMYVAGQSYIEMSKQTTTVGDTSKNTGSDSDEKEYVVKNKEGKDEAVVSYTYNYVGKDKNNYTTSSHENYTDESGTKKKDTRVQDYRTGEAVSVKSNQLAYIPNWAIDEREDGSVYLKLPTRVDGQSQSLRSLDLFKNVWEDLDNIPIIKTVVSGKTYYYFDFSKDATLDTAAMNEFIAAYSELLDETYENADGDEVSRGESYGLTNINDYDYFKIKNLSLKTDDAENATDDYMIYSNSAISVVNDTKVTIKAKSSNIKALTQVARNINEAELAKAGVEVSDDATDSEVEALAKKTSGVSGVAVTGATGQTAATSITTKLQSQYKEMKWLLSNKNADSKLVNQAHTIAESEMTPINHFFKFDLLKDSTLRYLESGYGIWISDADVEVDAKLGNKTFAKGNVKGVIICKGDVTFTKDVNSFEGLIVTGSKIKIDHSMDLTSNSEIVKSVLRECDESQKYKESAPAKDLSAVCKLFRGFTSTYKKPTESGEVATESMKSISAIQFEDILSFKNWMKNVE
ncbi:MAG: hypothetical protein J6A03_02115 [Lachnospiraceae bacterium]|nr:hypothetical protein [Lachnospiraceae bacterium]